MTAWTAGRLRLVFAGTPEAAVPSLRALLDSAARGRRRAHPAGRACRARAAAGPLAGRGAGRRGRHPGADPARPSDPEFLDALRDAGAGLLPGRRLRRAGAARPRWTCPGAGWVNLHFSLLPAWRGAAPVQAAIRHGDEITGAATFRLEEGLDTGPVYGVVTEAVGPTDTAGDLLGRLAESGAALLAATVDGHRGRHARGPCRSRPTACRTRRR